MSYAPEINSKCCNEKPLQRRANLAREMTENRALKLKEKEREKEHKQAGQAQPCIPCRMK